MAALMEHELNPVLQLESPVCETPYMVIVRQPPFHEDNNNVPADSTRDTAGPEKTITGQILQACNHSYSQTHNR